MAELVCDRLTLGYEGEALVKDLSFAVEKGNYLCIVGENGSGKSTLMRTFLGLQPPMAGQILTAGLAVWYLFHMPLCSTMSNGCPESRFLGIGHP